MTADELAALRRRLALLQQECHEASVKTAKLAISVGQMIKLLDSCTPSSSAS
jgi:hypothetical protein